MKKRTPQHHHFVEAMAAIDSLSAHCSTPSTRTKTKVSKELPSSRMHAYTINKLGEEFHPSRLVHEVHRR
eukprot:gene8936-biopygen14916